MKRHRRLTDLARQRIIRDGDIIQEGTINIVRENSVISTGKFFNVSVHPAKLLIL